MFQDQEFIDACSELEIPDVDGWEFFTESHDVTIYRLYNDVSIQYIQWFIDVTVSVTEPCVMAFIVTLSVTV